jgi:two-component system response regulator FlrC
VSATHVLIVEDDDATREVLVDLLTDAGYTVYEAPDGKPALERLRAHPEGMVVLLDWMMPGIDGLAVLQAVAAESPLAKRHSYILMSATGRWLPTEMLLLLKQLNVSSVPKPFDVDEMLAAVEQAASRLPEGPAYR